MILYSWKKIYKYSKGDCKKILLVINYLTYRPIPENLKDKAYDLSLLDWSGNCFILNPEKIFDNINEYSKLELAQYVGLASFRNYAKYKATRSTTLDLFHCPVGQDTLNNNRLLTIKDNQVHFIWEDTEKTTNGSI